MPIPSCAAADDDDDVDGSARSTRRCLMCFGPWRSRRRRVGRGAAVPSGPAEAGPCGFQAPRAAEEHEEPQDEAPGSRLHGSTAQLSPLPSQICAHRALPLAGPPPLPPPQQQEEDHDSPCRSNPPSFLPPRISAHRALPLAGPPPPPPEQQEEDHDSPCRGSDRLTADTTGTSWVDIPPDLADRILHCLPAHIHRVRFAAVCPQWRAATRHEPLPAPLPLLLLSDARLYCLPESEPIHFSGITGTGYIDACGDWLVFSREEGLFLRNPLSNATMTLPPLSRVRTRLVSSDGEAVWSQDPSTAAATLHVGDEGSFDVATVAWMEMTETLKLEVEPKSCKLLLCSSNLIVATINFRGGKRIAVCHPGATLWWSVWVEDICPNFVDMAFHQGKLYAIDIMATLFAIDVSVDNSSGDPWISQIQKVINGPCLHMPVYPRPLVNPGPQKRAYLVESRGVLLVVLRRLHYPRIYLFEDDADETEFEVFEADLNQSQWLKVTTIGNNEILFLRRRCSRSVRVPHNTLPGDSIFFLEDVWDPSLCTGSGSCRVYSMTDSRLSNPLPMVYWKSVMAFGTWLFPEN